MLNCVFVANNFIAVNFIELWQPTHTHILPDKFQLPEGQRDTVQVRVRDEVELRVEKLNSAQRVRRMFIIKLSLAEVVHSNLYEMLPTCHSIPGAQVYLKHLARNELTTCSTDSVAVVARSTSSPSPPALCPRAVSSRDRAQCQVRLLWALVRLMLFAASRNISLQRRALQLPQTRCSCVRHAVPSAGMAAGAGGRGGGLSLRRI